MAEELIFDSWSQIAFKRALGGRTATASAGMGWQAPTWVGDHARRLMAYTILRAYQDNAAREFMLTKDRTEVDDRREYGDSYLIVNTVVAALLGESQSVSVEGAEDWDPDQTDQAGGDTASGSNADAKKAFDLQEWLTTWAQDERLPLKMLETERKAIGLGDGVYSLGWSSEKERPRLRVWDPGFYFPVLDDGNEDDYPEKVHIAWELPCEDDNKKLIRRITWELGPIGLDGEGLLVGELDTADGVDANGFTRTYAWSDKPSHTTCYLSDGTWTLDTGKAVVNDLTEASAVWAIDDEGVIKNRDLQIDFIPVVHVPNTVAVIEHYGRAVLSAVLQLLDDLASADTDLQKASATTGSPVIALSRATMGRDEAGAPLPVRYRPGQVLEVGEGKMDVLDTSRSLDALIKYIEFLLKRLSVNSRIPEAVLGRVSPSEVPSGIALALSFGPIGQLVNEMRLVRNEKYPLLLRFAQRIAAAGGDPDVPQHWDLKPGIEFGGFLPQDKAEAVDIVTKLLAAKPRPTISLETAIQMLIEAGFPIRDAVLEVEKIQERDFDSASSLLDALGEDTEVWEYLGRKKPATTQLETDKQAQLDAKPPLGTQFGADGQPLKPPKEKL